MNRRRVIAVGGAVVVATALGSEQSATAAPAYTVTVSTVVGDRTRMSLHVMGSEPVGSIKADIRDNDGSVLATLTDFRLKSGTPTDSWWQSADHASLPRLDVYDVTVEIVAATGGDPFVGQCPRSLGYYADTFFDDLSITPPIIDFDHREVLIAATLAWEDPATRVHTPLPGRTVSMDVVFRDQTNLPVLRATATTDEAGRFEFREPFPTEARIDLNFYYEWPYNFVSGSASVGSSIRQSRLSLAAPESEVEYGDPIHLVGKLEMLVTGAWVPYAGQTILLGDYGSFRRATTDDDGKFDFVVPAGNGTYKASFAPYLDGDYLIEPASASAEFAKAYYHLAFAEKDTYLWHHGGDLWQMQGRVDCPDGTSPASVTLQIETKVGGATTWSTALTKVLYGSYSFWEDLTLPDPTYVRARVAPAGQFLGAVSRTFYNRSGFPRRTVGTQPPTPLPRR
ncbi:MAG: hypothetical protein HOV77_17175 [Hamadaea sp.]|uniref:hypothetical protein n=1 Tax=Hamadaea sp. TaxID=2024425 RepID=UPI001819F54E|nr:hypothetical protein [Hamadaea sp.]NUT20914.1 hypothetical protein [Hamadaea sp.]